MSENLIRLSKLMSQRGICSRREADRYIAQGMVCVDQVVVTTLGTRVSPHATIQLASKLEQQLNQQQTILLNKPVGYVSTQPEKGYRAAHDLIVSSRCWGHYHPIRPKAFHVAGRLDIESQGLLLLTQSGTLAKALIGPHAAVEKEYLVRVQGSISPKAIRALESGLSLDGVSLKPATVKQIHSNQLLMILTEGKKRQIRRMCDLVGLTVIGLKRVRIGELRLGGLPEGQWRFLKPEEDSLLQATSFHRQKSQKLFSKISL